ncbi:5'-nucleotidase-like [Rhipicephalus sanguineus]|uniref:5'-nucleotidase-like n=1 Tax=Rhipicephalus sanguineus TaxID=34632 RepID=UPI0018957787|nr:5'-nucleotidase-like [Rhipicephalus sanguineus]
MIIAAMWHQYHVAFLAVILLFARPGKPEDTVAERTAPETSSVVEPANGVSDASLQLQNNENTLFNMTILHTNDIHSRILESTKRGVQCNDDDRNKSKCFGGVARIKNVVRMLKNTTQNPLFLNAGDFFQGTLWYSILKYNIVSAVMANMSYDTVCLGNHEFDDGPAGLVPFLEKMAEANVTVLGTNLNTSNEPLFTEKNITLPRSIIYNISGTQVAFLGVVTTETMTIAKPGEPPEKDKKEGPYPFIYNRTSDGGRCLIVQDYRFGKYLGFLELEIDKSSGNITRWSGNPILLNQSYEEDNDTLESLKPYKEIVDNAVKEVVGSTKVLLEANDKQCRYKECNAVNLMADAFLNYYTDRSSVVPKAWSIVNAAVVNGGIARDSIEQKSNVTLGDVLGAMPYDSDLVLMNMTGRDLMTMFEFGVTNFTWWPDLNGRFLQGSGIRVVYNFSMPNGCRIVSLQVLCANCSVPMYSEVMENETYSIVTDNFYCKRR